MIICDVLLLFIKYLHTIFNFDSSKNLRISLNTTKCKKAYGNNMNFTNCVLEHYAHNRFSRKVVWIFFL
jgi:hypothetical protein